MIVPFGLEQIIKDLSTTPINQTATDPEIDCVEKTERIIGRPLAATCPLGVKLSPLPVAIRGLPKRVGSGREPLNERPVLEGVARLVNDEAGSLPAAL